MPATQTRRPLTSRQMNMIATLATERTFTPDGEIATQIAEAASGILNIALASSLIDNLLTAPRRSAQGSEALPLPQPTTRAGRMMAAGVIEATVTLPNGQHVTVKASSRKRVGAGWRYCPVTDPFAKVNLSVLGTKVGWMNPGWTVTWRTSNVAYKDAVRALMSYAAGNLATSGGYRVQEASRCGRCFRSLTDPISIDRGIGPECFGRSTGSQHVPATAMAVGASTFTATYTTTADSLTVLADALTASVSPPAAAAPAPVLSGEKQRARDLIAEALDAFCADEDRDFAMNVFDQLAASQPTHQEAAC